VPACRPHPTLQLGKHGSEGQVTRDLHVQTGECDEVGLTGECLDDGKDVIPIFG